MSLSQEQLSKYGLSIVDGGSEAEGVFNSNGTYYKINDFQRGKSEGLDQDKGAVFNSSLYEDSGADFSNFNTATDVENALKLLDAPEETSNTPAGPVELSPRLAHARARVSQYQQDMLQSFPAAFKIIVTSKVNQPERHQSKCNIQSA